MFLDEKAAGEPPPERPPTRPDGAIVAAFMSFIATIFFAVMSVGAHLTDQPGPRDSLLLL